jgi:hypothetical protein
MHAMGGLVTIGTDGLGGGHGGNESEVVILKEEGFKVQVFIGWKQARAQTVQRHRCSPLGAGGATMSRILGTP